MKKPSILHDSVRKNVTICVYSICMCVYLCHIVTIYVHIFLDTVSINKITNNKTILPNVRKQIIIIFQCWRVHCEFELSERCRKSVLAWILKNETGINLSCWRIVTEEVRKVNNWVERTPSQQKEF